MYPKALVHCIALASLSIVASAYLTTTAHADVHPLDAWLLSHPKVADQIVWEFPPPPGFKKPPANARNIWTRYSVMPYPSTYPALGLSAFPLRALFSRDSDRLQDVNLEILNRGLEPGRLVSTDPTYGIGVIKRADVPLKGFNPDFIPSGEQPSDQGAEIRAWSAWPDTAWQELRVRFDAYSKWTSTACPLYAAYAASNFTDTPAGFDAAFSSLVDVDPNPVVDPPLNLQPDDPNVAGFPMTVLDSKDAFALYVRLVAAELAMELNHCLPWSLEDYNAAELATLFDGRTSMRWVAAGPSKWGNMTATGHVVTGAVIPAPPLVVLGFLAQERLIGTDRLDTVLRLFTWERQNFWHVMGGATNPVLPAGVEYLGYNGRAPASRMINGTAMQLPLIFGGGTFYDPAVHHWVGGCGGASGFNAEILRVLNIPVERTSYGHQQNRFTVGAGERVSTAHADDPYGITQAPEIPIADILLDDATFASWFLTGADDATLTKYASTRSADLYFQYLPVSLLKLHCSDLASSTPHDQSLVMGYAFKSAYTVPEMEAKGLWSAIEAKIPTVGGCAALGYPMVPLH